jgi:FkbM family methyltransferase
MFAELTANYRAAPQLIFENAAVARQDGAMTLYTVHPGANVPAATCLASFDKRVLQKRVGYRVQLDETTVPALSLHTLLAKHHIKRVDLLQIDTEGFDFEVIKMVDFARMKPRVIQFEHLLLSDADRRECFAMLAGQGYRLHRQGINTLAYLPSAGEQT